VETFLLVLAAIFPVVNPPGSAMVFLSLTRRASVEARRLLARRVALNSFLVMAGALLAGRFILGLYGISVPILRVAGGIIVAVAGWKLLNEGSRKDPDDTPADVGKTDYRGMAFYPLTMPLTTGPGTIAVMISLGFVRSSYTSVAEEIGIVAIVLLAAAVIAVTIYICFAYADRVGRFLGASGTDVAVRLSAFILFCLGVQILWTGAAELLGTIPPGASHSPIILPKAGGT
jgi:multiple antibiotic resistance protein